MSLPDVDWLTEAPELSGRRFEEFHRNLAVYNGSKLDPVLPTGGWEREIEEDARVYRAEIEYIEAVRAEVRPLLADVPSDVDSFVAWYEGLSGWGPGQGDPLFPWLETAATSDQMQWFLYQEVAGEAGFEDLLAMTQVKMSATAKLEMARNYWDEMGRGREMAMHGRLLDRLSDYLQLDPTPDSVVAESLALGNTMIALARHRRYAFQSVGALGVIEMTAPIRADYVNKGLKRLRIPSKKRLYFAVHAVLDVKHSEEWNREVLRPLVAEDPRRAEALAEGALIRLWHGEQCFRRYRQQFDFEDRQQAA